jgi:uncharacterized protein DUF4214
VKRGSRGTSANMRFGQITGHWRDALPRIVVERIRHPAVRELLIFLAFLALTILMMWPWVLHLRDAVSDRGDAYAIVYWVWWDFHQTFHDPSNLFHATVFYPYQYTMAFTESDYGVSLLFFPLFALGLRPMTVHSIATLTAFAFAAYGMFRLGRTLSGSYRVAIIAALVFAFVPYHFQRLPHLHLIFTGWMPLLLEALVLFADRRTWRRALWLAITFIMNGLTAITWFILVPVPLVLSVAFLVWWHRLWRDRDFWIRGAIAGVLATVVLLPFLLPYYYVHKLYGFARNPQDVSNLSALPIHWLAISGRNKLWTGLGGKAAIDEFTLFPGFLPPLLAVAAVFLIRPAALRSRFNRLKIGFRNVKPWLSRSIVVLLDVLVFTCLFVTLLTIGYGGIHIRVAGYELFRNTNVMRPLILGAITLGVRLVIAYPEVLHRIIDFKREFPKLRANPRTVLIALGAIWGLTGFLGSFGMNFVFHRTLYQLIPLFRGLRAPVRWATICYIGLALLAGLGAEQFVQLVRRWAPRLPSALTLVALAMLILFEQRVAPIVFVRGEVDPDAITLRLRDTAMAGGIVEFPAERDHYAYYRYMLRAADHGRPIVTASSSFSPPIVQEIETLTRTRPIPDRLLEVLENIPTSYVVVHKSLMNPDNLDAIEAFMARATATGRLRFINSYGNELDDLYAVTKIEPNAKQESTRRVTPKNRFLRQQYLDVLNREPNSREGEQLAARTSDCKGETDCVLNQVIAEDLKLLHSKEFQDSAGFIFNLYRITFDRAPSYEEWERDRKRLGVVGAHSFAEEWVARPEFLTRYPRLLSNREYVGKLIQNNVRASRVTLLEGLEKGKLTRTDVLAEVVNSLPAIPEDRGAFVTLSYFVFLKRDPDPNGHAYWLQTLNSDSNGEAAMIRGFVYSDEYRARFGQL